MAEIVGARDPACATRGWWRCPCGILRGKLQCAQRAWIAFEKFTAKVYWVAPSGDGQLVESGLARELGVRVAHGAPDHDWHARIDIRGFDFEVLERVRVVHHAGHRHDVDAVFEQHVTYERPVGRGWFRGHMVVVAHSPALAIDAGANTVNGHRTKATALEFLLSRCLNFDRVPPLEGFCNLQRLARRIVRATAVVQAERATGIR